jgi:hypothetical protein
VWTPKRILLLVTGVAIFATAFFAYNRVLGGIDGLPPLPESCFPSTEQGPRIIVHPPPPVDKRLEQAFGTGCPELNWSIKLDVRSRNMVIAAESFKVTEDGRVMFTPLHIALFKDPTPPKKFPEINTIESDEAYLRFDQKVVNILDVTHHKLVEADLVRNVRVRNNRGTPELCDDISLRIPTGIVHYEACPDPKEGPNARQRIWTTEHVIMKDEHPGVDEQNKPPPTVVTAKGMTVYLVPDSQQQAARPQAKPDKQRNESSSSIERIVLNETVRMTFYLDAESEGGFLAGRPDHPVEGSGQGSSSASVATNNKTEDRSTIHIETDGPFEYDVAADKATFQRGKSHVGGIQEQVKVVRVNGDPNLGKYDQLYCDRLEIKFQQRPEDANTKTKSTQNKQVGSKQIERVDAIDNVQILSDSQMFNAVGTKFRYDAATRTSTLLSDLPEGVQALKDGNEIYAREIQVVSDKAGTYITANGPGEVRARDKHTDKTPPMVARWKKGLQSKKEGERDLFILDGEASFEDPQTTPPRLLRGDKILVWMDQNPPQAKNARPHQPEGSATPDDHGRRLSQIEVIHNVYCQAPEMVIYDTDHLMATFKDPPPGAVDPSPASGSGSGPSLPLLPTSPHPAPTPAETPGGSKVSAVPGGNTLRGSGSSLPNAQAENAKPPQKPITLTAHDVSVSFMRWETRNELLTLSTQGTVHVHQDPATKEDGDIDITGDFLTLTNKGQGYDMHVTGDVARLRLNKTQIAGPQVTIDQVSNHAEVKGGGWMRLESATTLQGEPLGPQAKKEPALQQPDKPAKSVPVDIYWEQDMTLDGRYVRYNGGVNAEQVDTQDQKVSHLSCDRLEVTLDKPISLKEGEKKGQSPAIQYVNCVGPTVVQDEEKDPERLVKLQRFVGPSLDIDNPHGKVTAGGKGAVRIFEHGNDEMTLKPGTGSGNPAKRPAGDKDEMKLTYIKYGNSMYGDKNTNEVKFRGNVEVFNLPAKDPNMALDTTKLPPGCFYMRSENLSVLGRSEKHKYQNMRATDNVVVQSPEMFGRASRVTYDEEKDQIVFEGLDGGMASVTKIEPSLGTNQKATIAQKITYDRKSGKLYVEGVAGIQGGNLPGGR